jgi:hypothetical protein
MPDDDAYSRPDQGDAGPLRPRINEEPPSGGWLHKPLTLVIAALLATGIVALGVGYGIGTTSAPDNPSPPAAIGEIPAPIIVDHGRWQCTGPQDHTVVIVRDPIDKNGKPYPAGINLTSGCTGTIGMLVVLGNQRDGIKVGGSDQPGGAAHDLEILSGWIYCGPRAGDVHQDGVQAGGGVHVHFHNLHVDCPQSNNSAFFTNSDDPAKPPTDVTCTACDLLSANAAANLGGDNSQDSGVRNSILRKGTGSSAPPECVRNASNPNAVNDDNVCIDPNPAIDTGQPITP